MRKPFYLLLLIASITLASCSTVMNNIPGVYTIDIQQGNIIDQDMIDQLRPKMTKRQVLYIMGSSMLVDVFHQKRWDYLYSEQPGGDSRKQKRLSLFFDGDELIGVQGDFRPSSLPVVRKSRDTTVEIPKRDLDNTLWGKIKSFFSDDEPRTLKETNEDNPSVTESDNEITETIDDASKEAVDEVESVDEEIDSKIKEQASEVLIKPLEEEKPQELEEITVDDKPVTTLSEPDNEIVNKVLKNGEVPQAPSSDNIQQKLKEVTSNKQPGVIQSEPGKKITEIAEELIENEKIPQKEDILQKIEEIQN